LRRHFIPTSEDSGPIQRIKAALLAKMDEYPQFTSPHAWMVSALDPRFVDLQQCPHKIREHIPTLLEEKVMGLNLNHSVTSNQLFLAKTPPRKRRQSFFDPRSPLPSDKTFSLETEIKQYLNEKPIPIDGDP
jgi:hypothetical protein